VKAKQEGFRGTKNAKTFRKTKRKTQENQSLKRKDTTNVRDGGRWQRLQMFAEG